MPRKKRKHIEDDLTIACNQMCVILSKQFTFEWFHVPNGGKRSLLEAVRFKRMGVKAGVSDFIIMIPHKPWGCIELKAPGKKPTEKQRKFLAYAEHIGSPTAVVDNLEDFQKELKNMLQ